MIPSVRSRLLASAFAFVAGAALANIAIFTIPAPDRWLWVGFAGLLVLTSAWGVVIADSPRRTSVWAVIGLQWLVVMLVVPLLWIVTLALSPDGRTPTSLLPTEAGLDAFRVVRRSVDLREAAANSVLAALIATAVAVPLALLVARSGARVARWTRALAIAVLLLPLVVWSVAAEDLAVQARLVDHLAVVGGGQLLIALPLATWLLTTAASTRALSRGQWLIAALATSVIVFAVATQDLVIGAALTAAPDGRTLPSALLVLPTGEATGSVVAALGLLWMAPLALLLAVVAGPLTRLLGRSPQ